MNPELETLISREQQLRSKLVSELNNLSYKCNKRAEEISEGDFVNTCGELQSYISSIETLAGAVGYLSSLIRSFSAEGNYYD